MEGSKGKEGVKGAWYPQRIRQLVGGVRGDRRNRRKEEDRIISVK